jgi:hypothetical protein
MIQPVCLSLPFVIIALLCRLWDEEKKRFIVAHWKGLLLFMNREGVMVD